MDIRELRDRADIQRVVESLGIEYKRLGATYLVKCPCHEDNHPSAFFKEGDNYIYCNVCRKNINAIDVIMAFKDCEFKDALHELECIEGVSVNNKSKVNEMITGQQAAILGVKMDYKDFLSKIEYKDILKMHLLFKKKKIADIERFLDISIPEKEQLNIIEKQLGN